MRSKARRARFHCEKVQSALLQLAIVKLFYYLIHGFIEDTRICVEIDIGHWLEDEK